MKAWLIQRFSHHLHIQLGLIKHFIKALDKNADCFKYLCKDSPKLSEARLKDGMYYKELKQVKYMQMKSKNNDKIERHMDSHQYAYVIFLET